jgi:hypothetical protein
MNLSILSILHTRSSAYDMHSIRKSGTDAGNFCGH